MFASLLAITLAVSLAVAAGTARAFTGPIERILTRIVTDDLAPAWLRYLRFAIVVTGVSAGVRIHELERYITPMQYDGKNRVILELTAERWGLELYRTVIETLQGVAWMLLVFFVFALVAYVVVRFAESRRAGSAADPR
jgi:hypothetical protein